ncbi:hypothetical protein [Leptospira alstonii]|uniref:hypothetical protein n=1 Tax=Leptospira alstonii TaxID=28452 RepID=UPI0012E98800|nr:hypothetical protein [Leptospira alstonii]
MNKSPYQIGKSIRILFIVSIFSLQSCDFETEVSIPKEIRITVIDHKNNQQEDGPYELGEKTSDFGREIQKPFF